MSDAVSPDGVAEAAARASGRPPRAHGGRRKRARIHGRRETTIQPAPTKNEINVTPLVDVVLVLLIIFMVVTPMLHRGVDLELPHTKNHSQRQDTGEQLVISVRGDGTYVEADRVDVKQLGTVVTKELQGKGRPVNVRAERTLAFKHVREVLDQLNNAGASQVNLESKDLKE